MWNLGWCMLFGPFWSDRIKCFPFLFTQEESSTQETKPSSNIPVITCKPSHTFMVKYYGALPVAVGTGIETVEEAAKVCGLMNIIVSSHIVHIAGWVGTVSSQMDLERLPVAPLYAVVRAYCSHVNMYCEEGTSVVLSSMTPSFLPFPSIERFSYDLEMKTRKQNRNNRQTKIERFDWFIERIWTRVAFGWLSERSGEKTSCLRTF